MSAAIDPAIDAPEDDPVHATASKLVSEHLIDAEAAAVECVLHKTHNPAHMTIEFHHVIPVAWQQFYQPPEPWPFPGRDPNGRGELWDDRTIPLCPTGHRNTHFIIVEFMKSPHGNDPAEARRNVKHKGSQYDAAYLALTRFAAAGGDIVALVAARQWGQA